MKKIYMLTTLLFLGSIAMKAQNFTRFDAVDNNGVKALTGLSHRTGKARITILVPDNFDVKNVSVSAEVDSDASFTEIPSDFTTPQTVTITKESALQPKTWTITFKKVRSAALPLEVAFSEEYTSDSWDAATTFGWAAAEIDDNVANTKLVRFGTAPTAFAIAFKDAPKEISYDLNVVGQAAFIGEFKVSAKSETGDWIVLADYNTANPMVSALPSTYTHSLNSDMRYVKWEYIQRFNSQNVNLNQIAVTASDGTTIAAVQSSGFRISNDGKMLSFSAPEQVNSVEVYNVMGKLQYSSFSAIHPVALPVENGVYIVRVTLKDGSTVKQQLIIK